VAVAGAIVASLATASGAFADARVAADRPGCAQALTPGDSEISMTVGGRERTATIHVPLARAGQRLPLVVALHSGGGLGPWFESYTGFSQIADGEGFVVLYPNGAGFQHFWTINDHNPSAPDDVAFISALLDRVESGYCVDVRRVYAFGVSNGGGMASRLGCDLSQRFAAIATIAGGYRSQPPCHPVVPVSVLEVHGTSDGSVPYDGLPPDHAGSVPLFLKQWIGRDRCRTVPARHRVAAQVLRLDWGGCTGGADIEHIAIIGGGHQLPGAMPPDKGPRSTISVPWLVWGFLRRHQRLSPPVPSGTPQTLAGSAPGASAPGATGSPASRSSGATK
jgi:polyhydroxybutyrate depolymerase